MTDRPNILLIVADQHRHDWLEGDPRLPVRAPNLAALARAGATFTRATTPSPLCAPARACLATGLSYDRNPVPNNFSDLPPDAQTYYRLLRDAGYFVAGVGKYDLHKATFDWNLDGSRLLGAWGMSDGIDNEGKFDSLWSGAEEPKGPYMNHLYDRELAAAHVADFRRRAKAPYADSSVSPLPDDAYLDNWIAANAHAVLGRRPKGTPWHMVVNFAGPHDPMDVTQEMKRRWDDVVFPPPVEPGAFDGDHQEVRRRYAAMIENIDRHIGALLEVLERDGELANTVVIYTSDHGEMLGDHGMWGKQVALEQSIRIPLIVAGPRVRQGLRLDALVSLEDIAATILEFAGVPVPPTMTARSFAALLTADGATETRDHVISGLDRSAREIQMASRHYGANLWVGLQNWRALSTKDKKLVVADNLERPVLLDMTASPYDLRDRSADYPQEVERLSAMLRVETADDGRTPDPGRRDG